MQAKTKMLQMSKNGQLGIGNMSTFTIASLFGGIIFLVVLSIMGSFQTILSKNGEATIAVNTSIGNVNSALNTITNIPIIILVIVAGIIITVVVLSFAFGGRREEGRD